MQPTPPDTKNEIGGPDLLAAMCGQDFKPQPWFYKTNSDELVGEKDFLIYRSALSNDEKEILEYIVLREAKCTIPNNSYLALEKVGKRKKLGFIFYKCLLPEFVVRESETLDWLFINSKVGDITIETDCQVGNIVFSANSNAGKFSLTDSCVVQDIRILLESDVKDISFDNQCRSGEIVISLDSRVETIYLSQNTEVKSIGLDGDSKCGSIEMESGKIDEIHIWGNCKIGRIDISGGCQCNGIYARGSQIGQISISEEAKLDFIGYWESTGTFIHIYEGVQCESLEITENSQVGQLKIRGGQVKDITIEDNYCTVLLLKAAVSIIRMHNCHVHELKWQAGSRGELYVTDSFINHLDLSNTVLTREAVLSFTDCSIHIIQLQNLLALGLLLFRNTRVLENLFEWQPEGNRTEQDELRANENHYRVEQLGFDEHYASLEKLKKLFPDRPDRKSVV